MKIVAKPSFNRDINKARGKDILLALDEKLTQIERAKDTSNITGLKLLRGYTHHYRIIVKSENFSYALVQLLGARLFGWCDFYQERLFTGNSPNTQLPTSHK